jgi:hypothetical protein
MTKSTEDAVSRVTVSKTLSGTKCIIVSHLCLLALSLQVSLRQWLVDMIVVVVFRIRDSADRLKPMQYSPNASLALGPRAHANIVQTSTRGLAIFLALLLALAVKVTVVLDALSRSLPDFLVLRIDEALMGDVVLLQGLTRSVLSCNSLLTVKIALYICHSTLPYHLVQSSLGIVTPLHPIHYFMADWKD